MRQPDAGSGPVLAEIELAFPKQGGTSVIEPQTYLYYIQVRPSRPSAGVWVPWNDETEKTVLEDFKRLWATNFLDDLSIRVDDRPYPNGVIGKRVIFDMEERPRVKIVDYVGTKKLEQTKIDEKLKEKGITIRLDSFVDQGLIRRVEGVVREMLSEKGYHDGRVTHEMKDVGGGPKLVQLTFTIDEGPQVKIRTIDFAGNEAVGDGTLKRQDEGEQGAVVACLVDHRPRHLPAGQVRGRRRQARRVLPRPRVHHGPHRSAGGQDAGGCARRQDSASSSCASR